MLGPFAGCATTLVASERLGQQWIEIDPWEDKAKDVLLDRMKKEDMVADDGTKAADQTLLFPKDITFTSKTPYAYRRQAGGGSILTGQRGGKRT